MSLLKMHRVHVMVAVTVHTGMTPHDVAHQIEGAVIAAGWREVSAEPALFVKEIGYAENTIPT